MASTFLFELVSPERLLFSEQVSEVLLPGSEGYLTVMANHSPMMTSIIPGIIQVKSDKGDRKYIIFSGFADITPEGVSVLAESAIPAEEFDPAQLQKRIDETRTAFEAEENIDNRNKLEDMLHQLTTVSGVLAEV